jgi:hypothetical protein
MGATASGFSACHEVHEDAVLVTPECRRVMNYT